MPLVPKGEVKIKVLGSEAGEEAAAATKRKQNINEDLKCINT